MRRFLLLLLFFLMLLISCNHAGERAVVAPHHALTPGQARVTIYLEAVGESGADLSFRLISAALKGRGGWQPLKLNRVRISRLETEKNQLLLGVAPLLADTYTEIRLTLAEVKQNASELLPDGTERQVELTLASPLELVSESSSCLFVKWHALASTVANSDFFSSFTVHPQRRPQVADLVTVLCRELATVYQISPDQNRVVAALGLPMAPGEIAFDGRRRRFYVVAGRDLLKFDAVTNRLLDTIALPQMVTPKALVLSPDGGYAYISDRVANRIIRVDVDNGFVERESIKYLRPGRLFYFPGVQRDLLAVLAPSESAVYLLDPITLKRVFILPVNGRPSGMARSGEYLYVSDNSSDKVALYSLKDGRLIGLIRVGQAPLDIVAENSRVYVSVSKSSYLSLLMPPQLTPTRRIHCRLRPHSLAISRNWQKIYVAGQNPAQLEVIDLQSGSGLGVIPLPCRPDQIVVWEM